MAKQKRKQKIPKVPNTTPKVWALAAYDSLAHAQRKNAVPSAICYTPGRSLLPFGGWLRQGHGVEVARRASRGETKAYLAARVEPIDG